MVSADGAPPMVAGHTLMGFLPHNWGGLSG